MKHSGLVLTVLMSFSIDVDGVIKEYTEWYVVEMLGKVLFESLVGGF